MIPSQYKNHVVSGLYDLFTDRVDTIASYAALGEDVLNTPAILVDIEEIEIGDVMPDSRTPLDLHVNLHCILSNETDDVEFRVMDLVSEILNYLYQDGHWNQGVECGSPENINALPSLSKPDRNGYTGYTISFIQRISFGDAEDIPGYKLKAIFLGQYPDVGTGHEADYNLIVGSDDA